MKRWPGLVRWVAIAILAVQQYGHLNAQAPPGLSSTVVDETAARIALIQDTVRLHLPLRGTTPGSLRVSAWLLSPEDLPSGAVAVDLAPGARAADLTLPLPKDKTGAVESGIGWYRIAYRLGGLDGATAQGILAIGAIAPNLLELHLAKNEPVMPGKSLSVRVYAGNPVTQRPFRDVNLTATFEYDDPASRAAKPPKIRIVRTARSDGDASALFLRKLLQLQPIARDLDRTPSHIHA